MRAVARVSCSENARVMYVQIKRQIEVNDVNEAE